MGPISTGIARPVGLISVGLAIGVFSGLATSTMRPAPAAACRSEGAIARLAEVPEASGVALSSRVPGRLWTHNDSSEPVLFALDSRGSVTGRLNVSGATVDDWEAIGVGPCPSGSCVYVADIGDNNATRNQITVHRLTEPADGNATAAAEAFHATYPDGPQDAEALLVVPNDSLYIVTKGSTGSVALYRFPRELRAGTTVQLEGVGKPRSTGRISNDERITDGAVTPDGTRVVLRTHHALLFYRTAELLAGNWDEEQRFALESIGEPQGEGVAIGPDNVVYAIGEGGGESQPGTFARLTCPMS